MKELIEEAWIKNKDKIKLYNIELNEESVVF